MKQLLIAAFIISTFTISCNTNTISGVYVCDQSGKKPDTTIQHESYDQIKVDLTCLIQEIDFKGKSTVSMKMKGGESVSSYVLDGNYVRIKGDGSDMLLEIKGNNTLVAEGFMGGIYHKK